MKEKDLHDLIRLSHSISAMRKQFIENLDAMAARVEVLLPEDSTPQGGYSKDWRGKHQGAQK